MRLDQLFSRLGATVVDVHKKPKKVVLLLRLQTSPPGPERWKTFVESLLDAEAKHRRKAAQNDTPTWAVDISRVYFRSDTGTVRYLNRIVLTGDVRTASETVGGVIKQCLRVGVEVTSMPLVSQKTYELDPANGKLKGAHDTSTAAKARSVALSGGNLQ